MVLTVELPANTELVSTKVNRGGGCTGTKTIACDLDFLSSGLVAVVEVVVRVTSRGEIVAAASAQVTPADADLTNNLTAASVRPATTAPILPPRAPSARKGVTRTGTAKPDVIRGTPFGDVLRGLAGADRLFGLGGADRLSGGPGNDLLSGGGGDDTIAARDGARDSISCGPGRDLVVADRLDSVGRDCEIIRR